MCSLFNRRPRPSRLTRARLRESRTYARQVWAAYRRTGLAEVRSDDLAEVCLDQAKTQTCFEGNAPGYLRDLARKLARDSELFLTPDSTTPATTTADRIEWEKKLRAVEQLTRNAQAATDHVVAVIARILAELLTAQQRRSGQAAASDLVLDISLTDILEDPVRLTQSIVNGLFTAREQAQASGYTLFEKFACQIDKNQRRIAGLDPDQDWGGRRKPQIDDIRQGSEMAHIQTFLTHTAFEQLFEARTALALSERMRFEHTLLLAPTGWGKTQTLEYLIHHDLTEVLKSRRSLIIMESEGDLVHRIARHPAFDPARPGNASRKLHIIEPGRPGYMPTFSFFNLGGKNQAIRDERARQQVSNLAVDLYRYIFRALRGAELTEKQGYVFVQLVQLLSSAKGATFETLLDCLDNVETAQSLARQHGSDRLQQFFVEKYPGKNFAQTREQIFTRLDTFRSSAETFVNMVSGVASNFDLLPAINSGSVILINTSKDFLGEETSRVFGRYMIALLRQASFGRSSRDTPCFVYLDEAQEYLDEKSGALFQQARKRAIGLTIAHQDLKQISSDLRATIQTNTTLKICGNGDYHDRVAMAQNMRSSPEFLTTLRKQDGVGTEFALFARDVTRAGAVRVSVPFGTFDRAGLLTTIPPGRWPKTYDLKPVASDHVETGIEKSPDDPYTKTQSFMPEDPPSPWTLGKGGNKSAHTPDLAPAPAPGNDDIKKPERKQQDKSIGEDE